MLMLRLLVVLDCKRFDVTSIRVDAFKQPYSELPPSVQVRISLLIFSWPHSLLSQSTRMNSKTQRLKLFLAYAICRPMTAELCPPCAKSLYLPVALRSV